jgi:hypothetical protein
VNHHGLHLRHRPGHPAPPGQTTGPPACTVSGTHELVANALVMKGEIKRTLDLRQEDLPGVEEDE